MPTEPVASEQTAGSGDVIPIRCAIATTFSGPTSSIRCANTAFTESAVAVYRFMLPTLDPSALITTHGCPFVSQRGSSIAPWTPE